MIAALSILAGILAGLWLAHLLSYRFLKLWVLRSRTWDLNICCGRTDAGGLNAAFNVFGHRWLFLTLRKRHSTLPRYRRLPLAGTVQRRLGQRIRA